MNKGGFQMTVGSLNELPNFLDPFFQSDIIDLKEHPDLKIQEGFRKKKSTIFDFSKLNMPVREELKYYLQDVISKDISIVTLKNTYLTPIQHLINFLNIKATNDANLSLRHYSSKLENEYKNYLESIGVSITHSIHGKSVHLKIYERAYLFVMDNYNGPNLFDKDIWKLDQMEIDSARFIESNKLKTISFYTIPNETNRNLAKKYIKYLITTTDKAISTINGKFRNIKILLTFLNEKPITLMNRSDVEKFIENLNKKKYINLTFNECIFDNIKFTEYLLVSGDLSINHFYSSDIKPVESNHTYKAVDESVIKQIFSVLNEIPMQESCMFLLLYSTGMRVSEVCAIKLNSMFENENGYFIKFYSQKMRKEVVNPIPKSLYDLLITQNRKIIKNYGKKTRYLFPNHDLKCYRSALFRERMQDWFKKLRIKNPDGTLYQFKPHDYRHTLATTMILHDIPSSVIQKILHHDSIEMTSSYIDIQDQQRIERHKKFINIKGEVMPIHIDTSMDIDDIAKVEWLKKSINAQMLPNGMCSLPTAMGKCPHGNSCLTCGDFRTSKEFLPVHQKHYQSVCKLLDYAKQQGWQRQVETNEEVKKNLETIIKRLEEIEKVEG